MNWFRKLAQNAPPNYTNIGHITGEESLLWMYRHGQVLKRYVENIPYDPKNPDKPIGIHEDVFESLDSGFGFSLSGRVDEARQEGSMALNVSKNFSSLSKRVTAAILTVMEDFPGIPFTIWAHGMRLLGFSQFSVSMSANSFLNSMAKLSTAKSNTIIKEADNKDILDSLEDKFEKYRKFNPILAMPFDEAIEKKIIDKSGYVDTKEGRVRANKTDYIVKGELNELYPMPKDRLKEKFTKDSEPDKQGWTKYRIRPSEWVYAAQYTDKSTFRITTKDSHSLSGKKNDFVVHDKSNKKDVWIVDKDVFRRTYRKV